MVRAREPFSFQSLTRKIPFSRSSRARQQHARFFFPLPVEPEPQSQVGSVPNSFPRMIAAAQPTPAVTASAPAGQFFAHAPHSMHEARLAISAFPPIILKTACGQTSTHAPQPTHRHASRARVSPFFKYP